MPNRKVSIQLFLNDVFGWSMENIPYMADESPFLMIQLVEGSKIKGLFGLFFIF